MTRPADPAAPFVSRPGFWRRLLPFGRKPAPVPGAFAPLFPVDRPAAEVPPATPPPAMAKAEPVRLLIWDLDETFWHGTLEEGGVALIARNVEIVRSLTRRGIVNAIASKNHFERVRAVLEEAGIWELFVMPQIAFQPKGELVRAVIENCQLRAPSVLFVDDNSINLNEVAHYNPGIQVALPDVLATLLDDPRCVGADDPQMGRLAQYKLLERRASDRAPLESDNTAFLRQSEIRISIHHDATADFARVHELVNRTNQLNFTKLRLSDDLDAARGAMQEVLEGEYNSHAATIKVADKYGYYGVCGFYMLRRGRLEHFLFSCRILNMGIEQLIYQKIGRPGLQPVGEVVSDPAAPMLVDWVSIVDDAEAGQPAKTAATEGAHQSICLRGGCELSQTAHYLRERHVVIEEFPYGRGAWGVQTPLADYLPLHEVYTKPEHARLFDQPWFDATVMQSRVYDRSCDVYVMAFGVEPYVWRYRHRESGLILPIFLGGGHEMTDITTLDYAEVTAKQDVGMSAEEWDWMRGAFEFAYRFDADRLADNLDLLFDRLADKRLIVILSNSKFGRFHGINGMNARVNEVVQRAAAGRAITMIAFDDIMRDDAEVLEMNHFRRDVYMRLAEVVEAALAGPAPPVVAAPPPITSRRNMLPAPAEMTGHGWTALGGAQAAVVDRGARYEAHAVMSHRLVSATVPNMCAVFGCSLGGQAMPGEIYAVSAWVWIPRGYRGGGITMSGAGFVSPYARAAVLELRETWQRIWSSVRVPANAHGLFAVLKVIGEPGEEIFTTAWKVEHGPEPTDFVAGGDARAAVHDAPSVRTQAADDVLGYRYGKGGLNNQKLGLLGLFMAAKGSETRRLRLPDLRVYDQLSGDKPVVPLGDYYSRERLQRFAARQGIEIVEGPARGPDEPGEYFPAASLHILQTQRAGGIATTDFSCEFFRHLTATVRGTPLLHDLRDKVFTQRGVAGVVQLRIEKDWTTYMRHVVAGGHGKESEEMAPTFRQIIAKVAGTLAAAKSFYVVCDEAALPASKDEIRAAVTAEFGIELWWKSDFVAAAELQALSVLDLSILDFEMAVNAPVFVGTTHSSFSNMVSFEAYARARAPVTTHYIYNLVGPTVVRRTDNGALHDALAATAG